MAELALTEGLERIETAFAGAQSEGRAALMPYMMGGFPDREGADAVARAYVEAGADLIELGVPFSDPLADGPVIHAAATEALAAGADFESVLGTCRVVSRLVPVVLMAYTNTVLGVGTDEFARRGIDAGAAGVIIPDLPWGEDESISRALAENGLVAIPLIAPTTLPGRRAEICAAARGFIYLVSTVGTTGETGSLPAGLAELIGRVKAEAAVPVAVGFGIATAEHAAVVGAESDGVIIGSRLVRVIAEDEDRSSAIAAVDEFLRGVKEAMTGGESG